MDSAPSHDPAQELLNAPPRVLLVMSIAYALSGPLQAAWKRYRRRGSRPENDG